jgi:hypothetical protein
MGAQQDKRNDRVAWLHKALVEVGRESRELHIATQIAMAENLTENNCVIGDRLSMRLALAVIEQALEPERLEGMDVMIDFAKKFIMTNMFQALVKQGAINSKDGITFEMYDGEVTMKGNDSIVSKDGSISFTGGKKE